MYTRIRQKFIDWISPKSSQTRFTETLQSEYQRQLDILGRYDAAETTDSNRNHWARVDSMSANASASPEIRKILRERSRYEIKNNSYGQGIVDTIANDTIGTGPRLQFCHKNPKVNKYVEALYGSWCEEIRFTEKLLLLRKAKIVDGEAFGMFGTNDAIDHPIKLDIALLETEQITSPYANWNENPENFIDGVRVNSFGTPISYDVLRYHPGDTYCMSFSAALGEYDTVPARDMIHYYTPRRPRQIRVVPETSPALPLFAQLRRATLAVVRAFEIAAMIAGIMRTTNHMIDPQRDAQGNPFKPFQSVNFYPGMLMSLPEGWSIEQFKAECPPATYKMLKDELICEIIRCFCVPFNIGAGRSDGYNYASGRMDFQTYERSIEVERYVPLESRVLRPTFKRFLGEAFIVDPFLSNHPDILETKSKWLFDSGKHVDPVKEAQAAKIRLDSMITSYADEIGAMGEDADDVFERRAMEKKTMERLHLVPASNEFTDEDDLEKEERDLQEESDGE